MPDKSFQSIIYGPLAFKRELPVEDLLKMGRLLWPLDVVLRFAQKVDAELIDPTKSAQDDPTHPLMIRCAFADPEVAGFTAHFLREISKTRFEAGTFTEEDLTFLQNAIKSIAIYATTLGVDRGAGLSALLKD
jgi:hypothetical protein